VGFTLRAVAKSPLAEVWGWLRHPRKIFFCWFLAAKPPKTNKKRGLGRSPSDFASALALPWRYQPMSDWHPSSMACLPRPCRANPAAMARRRNVTFNLLPIGGFPDGTAKVQWCMYQPLALQSFATGCLVPNNRIINRSLAQPSALKRANTWVVPPSTQDFGELSRAAAGLPALKGKHS